MAQSPDVVIEPFFPTWPRKSVAVSLIVGLLFALPATRWLVGDRMLATIVFTLAIFAATCFALAWRRQGQATASALVDMTQALSDRAGQSKRLIHDLENQLTIIAAVLGLLLVDPPTTDPLSPSRREYLEMALGAQRRLAELLAQASDSEGAPQL